MMIHVVYGVLAALLLAHVFVATTASVVVFRDRSLERFQVVFKLLVSWIIVYVGPLFILYVMNDHSPKLVPRFVQVGLLHSVFFGPIRPPPHGDNPIGSDGGYYKHSDASSPGLGGEGSCGAGGD